MGDHQPTAAKTGNSAKYLGSRMGQGKHEKHGADAGKVYVGDRMSQGKQRDHGKGAGAGSLGKRMRQGSK